MSGKHGKWGGPWRASEIERELDKLREIRREWEDGPNRAGVRHLKIETIRSRERELREELAAAREREREPRMDTNEHES